MVDICVGRRLGLAINSAGSPRAQEEGGKRRSGEEYADPKEGAHVF